jgi:membrane associated rhomboid family serine protease
MYAGGEFFVLLLFIGLVGVVVLALAAPLIPVRKRTLGAFPVVTASLIALNVLVYLATIRSGGRIDERYALVWGLTPHGARLINLLTYNFLHGDFAHILGNMLGLWLFGSHVEEALGRLEYLLFYMGCGIAAGLLHVVMAATLLPGAAGDPMIGASGALFGVLGLFAVRFYRTRVRVLLVARIPAIWAVGCFFALQLVFALVSFADGGRGDKTANWAHIGGFLFGMLLARPMRMREDGKREYRLEDASAAAEAGHLDQAAAFYRVSLSEKPEDAETHRELARVCARQNQSEAAHRHFLDALRLLLRAGNLPVAVDVYEEACQTFEAFPLTPALLYRLAGACEAVQKFPLALHALAEICRRHEDASEAEMALLRMGKLHLRCLAQPKSAQAIFAEFLRSYPDSEWKGHAERFLAEARQAAGGYEPFPTPQQG